VSYDFGQSIVTIAHITSLENSACYFLKGFAWPLGMESVLDPKENEAIVFKDFFVAGLCIPPHPVLLDILQKIQVQLHQLTPNAIIQISKFIWVVTSCGGCPTVDVFTHHYELHYQHKKIHFEGSKTTFAAQFWCISFHPLRFGNHSRLTPATRNKWTSGWDGNWFYYRVPSEHKLDSSGQRTYLLSSKMSKMNYLTYVPSSCGPEDANIAVFIEATSLIGGCDVVE
jgi:hypothetical protein